MKIGTQICQEINCRHFYDGNRGMFCLLSSHIVENQYTPECSRQEPYNPRKRMLPECTTETDEIGKKMGLDKKERESVYESLGLTSDGE